MWHRGELLEKVRAARQMTDAVLDVVTPRALYERPVAERHRLVFYLGHVDAFDWNLLRTAGVINSPSAHVRRPELESLFAFGIDPFGTDVPTDRASDWPSVDAIAPWIAALREEVDHVIETAPLEGWLDGGWALHLAIEHRLMHVETLSYLLSRLPLDQKCAGPLPSVADLSAASPKRSWTDVPAGRTVMGLSRAREPHLGWDNEYEAHSVDVPAFRIDSHKVDNGDFLKFVDEGGYRDRSLWTERDWEWREREGVEHPSFWIRDPAHGSWKLRAMFAHVPLPLAWPVYVSHAEASAYARWRGKGVRLPTEAEWHRAFDLAAQVDGYPARARGNFGLDHWDPAPVGRHASRDPVVASARGAIDELVGNGWEWTCTTFAPFRDFQALPFYAGYSANFFDDRHFVLKGASPRTPSGLVRSSFRNWFQPHYPYVYASFRCVDEGGSDDHGAS